MTTQHPNELTPSQKAIMFWGSFLALTAAGVGFVLRSMVPVIWGEHFQISDMDVGVLLGAGLWPIAVTMILFSLLVDKIGYKISMYLATLLQALSVLLTIFSNSFNGIWMACLFAGFGHGIIEACINPLCASIYRNEKSKWLNILHAAWPAGIALGGMIYLLFFMGNPEWTEVRTAFWWMFIPVLAYGVMFSMCKNFPEDERVENNISQFEMLKEFGALGAFLALTFLSYEITTQLGVFTPENRLSSCLGIGVFGGLLFGLAVRSIGRPLFFILCLIMIPLASAEIATDGWIQKLMRPALGDYSGWALVFSASIMMFLRFFAGIPLKFMSPPALLLLSSIFSIVGLFALSSATGILILFAFVFYAIGQTFFWPTMLGLVSEQFPKGGAMTLNTLSAIGVLTVGIFGFPFLGAVQDHYNAEVIEREQPGLVENIISEKRTYDDSLKTIHEQKIIFGVKYDSFHVPAVLEQNELTPEIRQNLETTIKNESGRQTLKVAALLPAIMAVAFILLMTYFKSKGGYRPASL